MVKGCLILFFWDEGAYVGKINYACLNGSRKIIWYSHSATVSLSEQPANSYCVVDIVVLAVVLTVVLCDVVSVVGGFKLAGVVVNVVCVNGL